MGIFLMQADRLSFVPKFIVSVAFLPQNMHTCVDKRAFRMHIVLMYEQIKITAIIYRKLRTVTVLKFVQ